MPPFERRLIDRAAMTVCLMAGLVSSGCGWLTDWKGSSGMLPGSDPPQLAEANEEAPPPLASADRAVLARASDAQRRSVWIRAVRPWPDDSGEPSYRWRNPALEELMARPPKRRPDWHRFLADQDPVVAANAAIALARSGDDSGAERLAETVRTPEVNQPMRCAAAEALAGLKGPSVVPLLRELTGQFGRQTSGSGSSYNAELHAELIRGLTRHVDPADDPHFVTALRSRAAHVRLAALEAWAAGRGGTLPVEVADLRADSDGDVRAAALQALARRRHPEAYEHLAAALRDHEPKVRTAAIGALGELGGAEARASLEGLLQDRSEATRAAAVSALDRLGAEELVLRAAGDQAWRVRLNVARALARRGEADRDAAATARQLLQDRSAEVQHQVVLALAAWPLRQAGPILLEAMGSRSLMTRRAAAEQLAARWTPATEFPIEGPAERRAGVLEELQGRFREQYPPADLAVPVEAAAVGPPTVEITPRLLDQVQQLVRRQDVRGLVDIGPELVEVLEQLALDRQELLPEVVYREVLPRYGPAFVALDRLASSEVSERQGAAGELAELARQRPLGRLAAGRMVQLVLTEPDPLVWQRALTAVADDASEPSVRLAYAAIGHPSAEVRRRACEHLAAHPHPGHAKIVLPALDDPNQAVVHSAVRALGVAGRPGDRISPVGDGSSPANGRLRQLLRTNSEYLRIETAVALTRLGDPAGTAELERLAYSADPKVRSQVAAAMGETADTRFTAALIRLLDDRPAVQRAALEGLPRTVGRDVSQGDDPWPASTVERVRRWKQWFERRGDIATVRASTGPD